MATPNSPPVLTELKLSRELKETVNTALARGRMMSVAYVSPEVERNLDKDRKGVALIIDLDSVDGLFGGNALKMRP